MNYIARLGNGSYYEFTAESDVAAIAEVQKRFPEVNEGMTCYLYSDSGAFRLIMEFHKVHTAVSKVLSAEGMDGFDEAFFGNSRNKERNPL